jgi:hypothetical protein
MNVSLALWVVLPGALFLALSLYVAFLHYRTRDVQLRSQNAVPTPAVGKVGLLLNVRIPADGPQPQPPARVRAGT